MKNSKITTQLLKVTLVLIAGITVWGCKPKGGCNDPLATNYEPGADRYGECIYNIDKEPVDTIPENSIKVNLDINVQVDGQKFELNKEYKNKAGIDFTMSTMKFYLANIKLAFEASDKMEIKDVELFNYDTTKLNNKYWSGSTQGVLMSPGKYDQIYIGVGVGIEENEEFDPNKYPADHALSGTFTGMVWDWKAKYIFSMLEGTVDSNGNGDFNRTFAYHSGHSDMYRLAIVNFDKIYQIDSGVEVNIVINLDLLTILDGIKFETDTFRLSHSADEFQKEISSAIQTNFSRAFSFGKLEIVQVIQ